MISVKILSDRQKKKYTTRSVISVSGHRKRLKRHDATIVKEAVNDLSTKTDIETGRVQQTQIVS